MNASRKGMMIGLFNYLITELNNIKSDMIKYLYDLMI